MEDALLFASMLMTIVRNADIVRIGCQSLVANISACIMTQRGGGIWKQTIFYPFKYLANHARGTVLDIKTSVPTYPAGQLGEVPIVDALVVENEGEIVAFAVNRSDNEEAELDIEVQGFKATKVLESVSLYAGNRKLTNEHDHSAVLPGVNDSAELKDGEITVKLPQLSFNMIRFAK